MSEHALPDPKSTDAANTRDGELIALNPPHTEIFIDPVYDDTGRKISSRSYEIWPLLDIRLSDERIAEIANSWTPTRVNYGHDKHDRPVAIVRWMMTQTHVTVDASSETRNLELYHEMLEFNDHNEKATKKRNKPDRLKNLSIPTNFDITKVSHADNAELLLQAAAQKLEQTAAGGLGGLIDYLLEVEDRVAPRTASVNLVRLFNAVDSKTGGKDPAMIIAKRILLIALDQAINPDRYAD